MCEATGDGLSDTPADPELNGNPSCAFNSSGNYTSRTDNWGDFYATPPSGSQIPSTANIMNYNGARSCRVSWSRLQIAVMLHSLYRGNNSNNRDQWLSQLGEYDDYEMDDFPQTARPIAFNEIQEHDFHMQYYGDGSFLYCDVDWVRFTPTCSGSFTVETSEILGRPKANTWLTLYDGALNLLTQNDDISSTNLFSRLTFNFIAGQEYLIKIENINPNGQLYYRLQVGRMEINESNPLCTSGTYSITGLPSGANVTWTVSNTSVMQLSCTTCNPVTVTRLADGDVTLTAQITNACGGNYTVTKQIHVGKPTLFEANYTYSGSTNPMQFYDGTTLSLNPVCNLQNADVHTQFTGATNGITWSKITSTPTNVPWSPLYTDGIRFYFWNVGQTAVFNVQASNTCGNASYNFGFKSINCSTGGGGGGCARYSVSPNPASTTLKVGQPNVPAPCRTAFNKGRFIHVSDPTIATVSVYDVFGVLKIIQKFNNVKTASLNIGRLPVGTYYVDISDGKTTERQQVLVVR